MNLLETYSSSCGLKYKKPDIHQHLYPITTNKYIIFHGGGGNGNFPSKLYDYWNVVIDFLREPLKKNGYTIYQIGAKDEIQIDGCVSLLGKTSYSQVNYLINNASLVFGNDSFSLHVAGMLDKPIVGVYGPTCPKIHGPHWRKDNVVLLEPDRKKYPPSFTAIENPKTINLVKPEKIARTIANILDLELEYFRTEYIGQYFGQNILEIVPNCVIPPNILENLAINIRADYEFNEDNIYQQLSLRKGCVILDKPLNLNYLAKLKPNISNIICKIKDDSIYNFVVGLKKLAIPFNLITDLSEEEVADYKILYCDLGIINQNNDFNKPDDLKEVKNLKLKTAKILISNGKNYHSYAHALRDIKNNVVIDDQNFWIDKDYFYIYQ